jgi:V8-like Glu-specific endopeptidase
LEEENQRIQQQMEEENQRIQQEIEDLQTILPQRYFERTKLSNFIILSSCKKYEIGIGFFVSPNIKITAYHILKDNGYHFASTIYTKVQDFPNIVEMRQKSNQSVKKKISEFDVSVLTTDEYETSSYLIIPSSCEIVEEKRKCACMTTFHIAMTQEINDRSIVTVGFGVTQASIVKISKNHFLYSSNLFDFDEDSGGAIVHSTDGTVIGLHLEAVNRAKEKLRHKSYTIEDIAESVNGITEGYSQCFLGLRLDSEIVKELMAL